MLLPSIVGAQTFQKTYGGATDDYAYAIQHTQDGNLVVAGRSLSYGVGQYDLYIIKMSPIGDTLWTHTYGNINYDEAFHIDTTSDGGLIVCGQNSSYDWAGELFLMKLDAMGNVVWDKTYGGAIGESDQGYAVRQTSDGGYVATGSTDSYGSGNADVYVVKTDGSGNLQWTRTIGGTSDDVGRDVRQDSNGNYYLVGYTESYGEGFMDVFMIKLSSMGLVSWTKVYGGGSYDFAYTLEQTTDGGFVIGATTNSYGQGDMEAMMIKTDVNGNIQWAKAYGQSGEDRAQVARQTSDGGYIMAGRTNSFGGGNYDSYLIKTDASGNLAWDISQGGNSWDQAWDVQQMPDGGYVVAGFTLSYGQGGREVYVFRTDSLGQSGCNEATSVGTVATTIALETVSAGVSSSGGLVDDPPTAVRAGAIVGVQCEETGGCPESIFIADQDEICKGDTVFFTNQSVDADSYQWLLDGVPFSTGTDPSYVFENNGVTTVSLIAIATGCNDTSELDVTVYLPPTVDAGDPQLICVGSTVILNGSYSSADGIVWTSSGTGQFNDPNITNAIYDPSEDDEISGSVTLYLTTNALNSPCPAAADSVIVTIDQCVGIQEVSQGNSLIMQRYDVFGRPVGIEYVGLQFILFKDGTVRKVFNLNQID